MRLNKIFFIPIFTLALFAQSETQTQDELQKALQSFMLLLEKSQMTLKELTDTTQSATPKESDNFELFYKRIKNTQKIEKRNDILIKTQIGYKFLQDKDIPSTQILIIVKDAKVELYGKIYSKKIALKMLDIALHTKGVKEVTSYLIIKELKGILL
jgi:osmotically-inducible protein OsmY